jgi:hypothetical protein
LPVLNQWCELSGVLVKMTGQALGRQSFQQNSKFIIRS